MGRSIRAPRPHVALASRLILPYRIAIPLGSGFCAKITPLFRCVTREECAMEVRCPVCSAVLRRIDGIHGGGEPPVWSDPRGQYVQCNECSTRLDWPLPKP